MSFEEMSKSFQMAFGLSNAQNYKAAIELYEDDLLHNPKNIASLNNIAVAKINLGISENDKSYLIEAKELLEKSIRIVNEQKEYKHGFPIAEGNLKWVNELLEN